MLASVSYLARLSDHVPALPAHAEMAVGMLNYVYERSEHFLVLELLRLLLMQLASYECSSIFRAETAPTKCFGRLAKSAEGFYTVIRFWSTHRSRRTHSNQSFVNGFEAICKKVPV